MAKVFVRSQQQFKTPGFGGIEEGTVYKPFPAAFESFHHDVAFKVMSQWRRRTVIKEDEHRPAGQIVAKAGARQGSARQIQAPSQSVAATNGTTP